MYIKEVYRAGGCYLSVKLDRKAIDALQLDINALSVKAAILGQKKLKLKDQVCLQIIFYFNFPSNSPQHIQVMGDDKLRINAKDRKRETMLYSLQSLKNVLPAIIVQVSV